MEYHILGLNFLSVVWFLWNDEVFAPELHRDHTGNLERWCDFLSVREVTKIKDGVDLSLSDLCTPGMMENFE